MSYILVILGLLVLCAMTVWLIEGITFAFKPDRLEFARTRVQRGLCALVLGVALLATGASLMPEKPKDPAVIATEDAAEKLCRGSRDCWSARHLLPAMGACQPEIEKLAKYKFEWMSRFGINFNKKTYWKNVDQGVLTYAGDELYFQNAFGASVRVRYECDFNTLLAMVAGVRITEWAPQ